MHTYSFGDYKLNLVILYDNVLNRRRSIEKQKEFLLDLPEGTGPQERLYCFMLDELEQEYKKTVAAEDCVRALYRDRALHKRWKGSGDFVNGKQNNNQLPFSI